MPKRAIIIHGWEGSPNDAWIPWLKAKLKKKNFIVSVPAMPDPSHTHVKDWVEKIARTVKEPNDDCYFVGHSLGCISIIRYLESLPANAKVGGCVFVAGFIESIDIPQLEEFTAEEIDMAKVSSVCPRFVVIGSDNDEEISLDKTERMAEQLGAKLIVEEGQGHFDGDANVKELPSALKAVMEMEK